MWKEEWFGIAFGLIRSIDVSFGYIGILMVIVTHSIERINSIIFVIKNIPEKKISNK